MFHQPNLTEKGVREVLGGALRPGDARRFLVEAMVAAMNADGVIDPREMAVLERHLDEHDLFQGVSQAQARTLIALAEDAIRFAGGPHGRIAAIARGLPSRIQRLTAYAMACEVVKADDEVTASELGFLDHLRLQLRIGAREALELFEAIDARKLGVALDQRAARIRGLVPIAADLFGLRAHMLARTDELHRARVRDFFLGMPDLARPLAEIERHLAKAFAPRRLASPEIPAELQLLAAGLPDPIDRWWMVVYVLAIEPAEARGWRKLVFAGLLQYAFGLSDLDMDLATVDAYGL